MCKKLKINNALMDVSMEVSDSGSYGASNSRPDDGVYSIYFMPPELNGQLDLPACNFCRFDVRRF